MPNWYRIMYHSQVVDWMVPRLPVLLLPYNIPNPMFDSTTMYVLYFYADDDLIHSYPHVLCEWYRITNRSDNHNTVVDSPSSFWRRIVFAVSFSLCSYRSNKIVRQTHDTYRSVQRVRSFVVPPRARPIGFSRYHYTIRMSVTNVSVSIYRSVHHNLLLNPDTDPNHYRRPLRTMYTSSFF